MPSFTVENYIKAIYRLEQKSASGVSTNDIAESMGTKAATVTDMLKKLSQQKLIKYKPYHGTGLTTAGREMALDIVRKHRLWEVFLVEKLDFKWDEVHDLAEDLEHIESEELINRLEEYLDHPKYDPHGDPIPDREGNILSREQVALTELGPGESGVVTGVKDSSNEFLRFLDTRGVELGKRVEVIEVFGYDNSRRVKTEGKELTFSHQVSKNLFVKREQS